MRSIHGTITTTGTAQQISPNNNNKPQVMQVYCSWLTIQNNGTHNMRVGDNTTTSTAGIIIGPQGSLTGNIFAVRGTLLSTWWIEGTAADVYEIAYETSN